MRTPQLTPDWNYGIWNGHNVMVKPVDQQLDQPSALSEALAWDADAIEDSAILFDQGLQ